MFSVPESCGIRTTQTKVRTAPLQEWLDEATTPLKVEQEEGKEKCVRHPRA